MKNALLILALALASPAAAEPLEGRIVVIDGDTVWHYSVRGERPEKIRLLDIDAPETHGSKCEAELAAGYRAKARLVELLAQRPVSITRCGDDGRCTDRFGRTLARISTPGGEVGAILLREGLALPYVPGRKAERAAHWCGGKTP